MTHKITHAVAGLCVATVITQIVLFTYFATRGTVNGETLTKVVGLINGIDITGKRLQQILQQSEASEQPDFEQILDARKLQSLDMDLRMRSQNEMREQIRNLLAELTVRSERFDERRLAFDRRLERIGQAAQQEGLAELQRILQSLDAPQAKQQLVTMYDDERIDDVVIIVQAMTSEKRREILAEFVSADESEKLAEILRRIGEGRPTTSLVNELRDDR
jgi:hypothetical protein